jgi:hypothetical protein
MRAPRPITTPSSIQAAAADDGAGADHGVETDPAAMLDDRAGADPAVVVHPHASGHQGARFDQRRHGDTAQAQACHQVQAHAIQEACVECDEGAGALAIEAIEAVQRCRQRGLADGRVEFQRPQLQRRRGCRRQCSRTPRRQRAFQFRPMTDHVLTRQSAPPSGPSTRVPGWR